MPDTPHGQRITPAALQERLHEIARLLRRTHHLGPEAQQELARLADELGAVPEMAALPSTEAAQLLEQTTALVEALQRQADEGLLAAARDRLEEAVYTAAARAPLVAGVARRLLETLANLGI
jgi:hypothetical protein